MKTINPSAVTQERIFFFFLMNLVMGVREEISICKKKKKKIIYNVKVCPSEVFSIILVIKPHEGMWCDLKSLTAERVTGREMTGRQTVGGRDARR